jgi:glutaredoxin
MFCQRVKEFLSQQGVAYIDRDVSADEKALDELSQLRVMTTPVVIIDGEIVVGFDREKLEQLITR